MAFKSAWRHYLKTSATEDSSAIRIVLYVLCSVPTLSFERRRSGILQSPIAACRTRDIRHQTLQGAGRVSCTGSLLQVQSYLSWGGRKGGPITNTWGYVLLAIVSWCKLVERVDPSTGISDARLPGPDFHKFLPSQGREATAGFLLPACADPDQVPGGAKTSAAGSAPWHRTGFAFC